MSSKVALTDVTEPDLGQLFEWINDRALVELSAPFRPVTREQHEAWFTATARRDDVVLRAIRLRDDGRLIGTCQLHVCSMHGTAELRIRIGAGDAQGRGHGRAAVQALLVIAFEERGLHRVWLHVFATNERALRCYERAGFTREGTLREAALIGGARVDVVTMGVLRAEFLARRAAGRSTEPELTC